MRHIILSSFLLSPLSFFPYFFLILLRSPFRFFFLYLFSFLFSSSPLILFLSSSPILFLLLFSFFSLLLLTTRKLFVAVVRTELLVSVTFAGSHKFWNIFIFFRFKMERKRKRKKEREREREKRERERERERKRERERERGEKSRAVSSELATILSSHKFNIFSLTGWLVGWLSCEERGKLTFSLSLSLFLVFRWQLNAAVRTLIKQRHSLSLSLLLLRSLFPLSPSSIFLSLSSLSFPLSLSLLHSHSCFHGSTML